MRLCNDPVLFHIPADPLITPHARSNSAVLPAATADAHGRECRALGPPHDQPIVESLVIPFVLIVLDELSDRAPKVALSQRNHSVETFFFDRPNEPFGIGIRIRGALRCQDHADSGVADPRRTARLHFRSRSQISTR